MSLQLGAQSAFLLILGRAWPLKHVAMCIKVGANKISSGLFGYFKLLYTILNWVANLWSSINGRTGYSNCVYARFLYIGFVFCVSFVSCVFIFLCVFILCFCVILCYCVCACVYLCADKGGRKKWNSIKYGCPYNKSVCILGVWVFGWGRALCVFAQTGNCGVSLCFFVYFCIIVQNY